MHNSKTSGGINLLKTDVTLDDEFERLFQNLGKRPDTRELLKLTGLGRDELDIGHMSHSYFKSHWNRKQIDQNANGFNTGPINYGLEIAKPGMKLLGIYLLHRYTRKEFDSAYADRLIKGIIKGDYYFHDASGVGIQMPYCFAYSTHWLIGNGIPWGQLKSLPPKRASSFISQVAELTMEMSQNFAGAIAPSDTLVAYSYFAEKEGLTPKEIVNDLQSLVHILNKQFRPGGQSPFTNISIFDRPNLERMFGDLIYPDGSKPNFKYVMRIQALFLEWFCKGDPSDGLPYRFPIATVNFQVNSEKIIQDREFLHLIAESNLENGCLNIFSGEGSKMAMCCRYINDPARMREIKSDTFGNGGLNIGSHRVVTINLPRIGYRAKGNWEEFYDILDLKMSETRDLLLVHRNRILTKRISQGFLHLFNEGLMTLNQMFSTFGFVGIKETLDAMGESIYTLEGQQHALQILKFIDNTAAEYSSEHGVAFNIEQTPAEGAAIKLVEKDKILYPDDVKTDLYSNQFFPLIEEIELFKMITGTGKLMDTVSGGAILHINLSEKIKNKDIMMKLIEFTVKSGVNHFAVNYGFSVCEEGHVTIGEPVETCPECGSPITEHLTRIVGYFVPISSWGSREKRDFHKRKWL